MKNLLMALVMVWTYSDFVSLRAAVDFMNKLKPEQKPYVIALNSERSGMLNGYYSVIYLKD